MCEYDGLHLDYPTPQAFISVYSRMPQLIRGRKTNSMFTTSKSIRRQAFELTRIPLNFAYSNFTLYRENRKRNYLLLNNNGKTVLGFAFVEDPVYGNNFNHLTLIATKQVYNALGKKLRTGYGSQIMNAIYNNAKARGRNGVEINHAVLNAIKFYRKKGYNNVLGSPHSMRRYATPRSSPTSSPSKKRKRNN